jgi:Ca-activated chloride channel family protein
MSESSFPQTPSPGGGAFNGAPFDLEVTLARPAVSASVEPETSVYARVRLKPRAELSTRPQLDLCFVLDTSASMHRFVLDPEQRAVWQRRAEQRGEVSKQQADGRAGTVWTGQTLQELQRVVSTPMISTLRGVWRTLEALDGSDRAGVLAFADQFAVIYEDAGVADRSARLEAAKTALTRLGSGVDESGLGRGTRLAGALQHALDRLSVEAAAPTLRRMILVSDGIIEDRDACRALLDIAVDRGLVISVIGVGDEFDEEFLMTMADFTRGSYYYAATAPEVEKAVTAELETMARVVGLHGMLRVHPEGGTIIHDVFPVSPALAEFQTMWVENGGWRFRIGDLSVAQPPEFLVELAPAAHPGGQVRLGSVRVEGTAPGVTGSPAATRFSAEAPVHLFYSDEAMLLQARDDEVLDSVRRLEIYLEERRAARAAAGGDQESATRHLRAATRMLRGMGHESLADEMDAAASDTETGTRNLSRTKRVKAGTRRLGEAAKEPEAAPSAPGARQLNPETRSSSPETRNLR